MNRVFTCCNGLFQVPDETLLSPFLNARDLNSGLDWDTLEGMGITAGQINPGVVSQIHVHPFTTLVTIILKGSLSIHMKDPGTPDMRYTLLLKHDPDPGNKGFGLAAALTLPGTFIQHDNSQGREPAQVLYLTSPAFVFEPGPTPESMPTYDDAIVVRKDWARLAREGWQPAELNDPSHSYAARRRAMNRLARKSYCRS
ncbi:MAG: hypothetical protein KDE09_21470 [Anaerolineales bacterium]|nr:hypothetical protein [Anaerolineales bacterium]